jgi:peroxiredoxin
MKHLLISLITLNTLCLFGQTRDDSFFILKGHIKHNTDSVLQFGWVGFLETQVLSTRIDKQGNFETKIKIETDPQPVFFEMGDGYQFYFTGNDTVTMDWDAQDDKNTFTIRSTRPEREKELQATLSEEKKYIPQFRSLLQSLYKDHPADSIKASRLNQLYNEETKAVLANGIQTHTGTWLMDLYYRYAEQMHSLNLFPAYNLTLDDVPAQLNNIPFFAIAGFNHGRMYQLESEDAFLHSSSYRDFLYEYIRFYDPLRATTTLAKTPEEQQQRELPFTPAWKDYYTGLRSFRVKVIRDWFITKCIIDGFNHYNYDEVSAVYKDFMTRDPAPYYAAALKENYGKLQSLKPGAGAPDFTLKDDHGRQVSLSSLRGKVIYLDFWGVYCGPCMAEINDHTARLHERYKDKNVVFVNICVDASEKEWKNTLVKTQLKGVNLITQFSGPVCSTYNISGIPHYYLIDQAGRIVDNNAPRPSQGNTLTDALDKMIK